MEQDNQQSYKITPSARRAFSYFLFLTVIVLFIFGVLYLINRFVTDLVVIFSFLDFFEGGSAVFIKYLAIIAGSIIGAVVLLNYLSLKSSSYCFYNDRLEVNKVAALLFRNTTNVSYSDIINVVCEKKGFLNGIFNLQTIKIFLTDSSKPPIELNFVEDAEQKIVDIKSLVEKYKYVKQSGIYEKEKIDNIVDKY